MASVVPGIAGGLPPALAPFPVSARGTVAAAVQPARAAAGAVAGAGCRAPLGHAWAGAALLGAVGGIGWRRAAAARRGRRRVPAARQQKAIALHAVAVERRLVRKGKVSAGLPVPPEIPRPPYVAEPEKVKGWWNARIEEKSPEQVAAMRAAGKLAHATLDLAETLVTPGRTTEEMEAVLHKFMCDNGAYPSDLGYKGFPKSVMISINEVICHGIPDDRPLEDGDLVNVDVTLYLGGYHADTARSWVCGTGDDTTRRLVSSTREALDAAIAVCRAGAPMKLIGAAVSAIAEREGFGVVKTLVGHGIGEFFHGVPQVFHCRNSDNRKMQAGTTFTIEPVFTEGTIEWLTWDDGWTIATRDGGRAAQFEHTLLITEDGCEVLT